MFGQPPDVTTSAGAGSDAGSDGTGRDVSGESEIRIVEMEVPSSPDEELGFKLTKTLWDPYPWVREVNPTGRAARGGLKLADCILQVDGENVIGLSVSRVASIIRSSRESVKLQVWNCGTNPSDDPESLFTPGGSVRGERARAALRGVLAALSCGACGATSAPRARRCRRGHLLCAGCRPRLDRCPLCRDLLPAAGALEGDCLVAKQVFEAIASVYGLETGPSAPRSAIPSHMLRPQLSKSLTNLNAGRCPAAPVVNNSLENIRVATLAGSCQSLNACSNSHLCLDSTPIYVLTPMALMRCEQAKQ